MFTSEYFVTIYNVSELADPSKGYSHFEDLKYDLDSDVAFVVGVTSLKNETGSTSKSQVDCEFLVLYNNVRMPPF